MNTFSYYKLSTTHLVFIKYLLTCYQTPMKHYLITWQFLSFTLLVFFDPNNSITDHLISFK